MHLQVAAIASAPLLSACLERQLMHAAIIHVIESVNHDYLIQTESFELHTAIDIASSFDRQQAVAALP